MPVERKTKPTIVAISGSLRPNSSNSAVIKAAAELVYDEVNFIVYEGLGSLPHFNDDKNPAIEVVGFRNLIKTADGIFICSPEYAFGVPGVLKNAIDWTVSTGEFVDKPVALITAATGGDKAHASLLLTLSAISARVPEHATLLISFIRSKLNENNEVKDPAALESIRSVMNALIDAIRNNSG
jgi:chromate reductase, NAD(P)H dehydrogenase (quinone)